MVFDISSAIQSSPDCARPGRGHGAPSPEESAPDAATGGREGGPCPLPAPFL